MIKSLGHAGTHRRVAINVGSGFVPGTNAVVMGAAIAGGKLGWEMIGIRDGFAGLLFPENYPNGGVLALSPELIENLDPSTGGILGQSPRVDPFHAASESGKEVDLSDAILKRLKEEDIDALISIVKRTRAWRSSKTPQQRASYGLHSSLHRKRHCIYSRFLWFQQRAQRYHRNAEQSVSGGKICKQNCGG